MGNGDRSRDSAELFGFTFGGGRLAWQRLVAPWLVRALIVLAPLLIGGLPPTCLTALLGVALACVALQLSVGRFRFTAPVIVLAFLGVYSLLFALPLPEGLVRVLAPFSATVWQDASRLVAQPLAARLGIEPEAARMLGAQCFIYAALWGSLGWYVLHDGKRFVSRTVFVLALTLVVVVFLHRAFEATRVYGLYQPLYATRRPWFGPLLNPNNLAAVLNLGGFCGVSLVLRRSRTGAPAGFLWVGIAVLFALSVATGSRGGAACLGFGFLGLLVAAFIRGETGMRWRFGLVLLGGATVALAVLGLSIDVKGELFDSSLDKFQLVRHAAQLAVEHPIWGVGPGGFAVALGEHRPDYATWIYEFAENFVVDWALQWGTPVALATSLGLGYLLFAPSSLGRSTSSTALWFGALVVVVQNLVDMGFQVPGVLVPWLAVLCATQKTRLRESQRMRRFDRRDVTGGLVLATALLLLACGNLWSLPRPGHVERLELGRRSQSSPNLSLELVRDVLARHPADPYVLRLGALVNLDRQAPLESLAWSNASMNREPQNGRGYLLAAEALHRLGHGEQALVTLRHAAADPTLVHFVAERAMKWAPRAAEQVVPDVPHAARLRLALLALEHDPERRLERLRAMNLEHDAEASLTLASTYLELATPPRGACGESAPCLEQAAQLIEQGLKREETRPRAVLLRARYLVATGEADAAVSSLLQQCGVAGADPSCWWVALELSRNPAVPAERLRTLAQRVLDHRCGSHATCVDALRRVLQLWRERGDLIEAFSYQQQILTRDPNAENFLAAAALGIQVGRFSDVLRFLERAESFSLTLDQRRVLTELRERSLRSLLGTPGTR